MMFMVEYVEFHVDVEPEIHFLQKSVSVIKVLS